MGSVGGSEIQRQEMSRRMKERRAAVDVSIIIATFLLCFLPFWITGICRQFVKSIKVPAEVALATACIFFASALCNLIIYSIRKKDFRSGVKKVLRRIGFCRSSNDIDNNVIGMNNLRFGVNLVTASSQPCSTPPEALATGHQDKGGYGNMAGDRLNFQIRGLSPIPEIAD